MYDNNCYCVIYSCVVVHCDGNGLLDGNGLWLKKTWWCCLVTGKVQISM